VIKVFHRYSSIAVIAPDVLPYPGLPTTGSALRAWGLGMGLKANGLNVQFCMPRRSLERFEKSITREMWDNAWDDRSIHPVLKRINPDLIIVCGWGGAMRTFVYGDLPDAPILLDQHGPHLLERAFQGHRTPASNEREKVAALARADFFSCAGRLQLDYFKPFLARAGWTPAAIELRSAAIPLSLSPELPIHNPLPPVTFVYGGVFLPWQDPSAALTTLAEVLDQRQEGQLEIFGGKHPSIDIKTGIFDQLVSDLSNHPRVRLNGMVSNDVLRNCYQRSHVAIDLMARNRERELAVTTRTVEYLWCGLPVIYNGYSELSSHIAEYEAGWIVDPSDKQAIARTVRDILDNPAEIARRSENAQRLARECMAWDRSVRPLARFEELPPRAGKRGTQSAMDRAGDALAAIGHELRKAHNVADIARLTARLTAAGITVAKSRFKSP
jgi:glycosyltransferase involved in cell wall biosynthesis